MDDLQQMLAQAVAIAEEASAILWRRFPQTAGSGVSRPMKAR